MTKRLPTLASLIAGLVLSTAFPPLSQSDAIWFAFVPLAIALRHATPRRGFLLGWLFGLAFWFVDLAWLWQLKDNGGPLPLVLFGHGALAAWCALFPALFGAAVAYLWGRPRIASRRLGQAALVLLAEPLLWVGSEYLRGILLTGFAWNPLAASQYRNPALLSCISALGVGALSFQIIAVNGAIALLLERIWRDELAPRFHRTGETEPPTRKRHRLRAAELLAALALLFNNWSAGIVSVRTAAAESAPTWRIALVHPDAPCIFERDGESVQQACDDLLAYTTYAGAAKVDLTLWPETSLPGMMPYATVCFEMARYATEQTKAPLLAGGIELEEGGGESEARLYNSAYLFDRHGKLASRYDKRHLVPFGEYIPLESTIPFLKRLAPAGFSCEAGTEATRFPIEKAATTNGPRPDALAVTPLICFEDTFPYLAREAAASGATLLATLANDAWFDGSSEPEQHLAQAVLRCVENRRPMARSTNRGVTCHIDAQGRILRRIGDGRGAGTPGFLVHSIPVDPAPAQTLYTRHGDRLLHIPALVFLGGVLLAAAIRKRRRAS